MASNDATPSNEEGGFTFTPGQTKLMMAIIQHSTEVKFDADAVAASMGYKDRGVVAANWSRIKRSMKGSNGATASPKGNGVKKSGGSGKKTGGRGKKVEAEDGDDAEETPTKKGRKGKKSKEVDDGAEDAEEKVKVEEKEGEGGEADDF